MNTTSGFDVDEHQENNPDHYINNKIKIGIPVYFKRNDIWFEGLTEDDIGKDFVQVIVVESDTRYTVRKTEILFHKEEIPEE